MSTIRYEAVFEMANGKRLSCVYFADHFPGSYWEPPSSDVSEPEFEIDGDPVAYERLPRGLSVIADGLYESDPPRYGSISKSEHDRFDDSDWL